jgi:archaellum biogenesis protein FlaJ (TadC family)
MFLDVVGSGKEVEVASILSIIASRLNDLRHRRLGVARTFITLVLILQPIAVSLLSITIGLGGMFNRMLVGLPFFQLYPVPIDIVALGSAILVVSASITSGLGIVAVRAGFRATAMLYIGLLLVLSAIGEVVCFNALPIAALLRSVAKKPMFMNMKAKAAATMTKAITIIAASSPVIPLRLLAI